MAIEFPPLPYGLDGLEPYISKETLKFHYGKHHEHYVKTLNELIKDTPYDRLKLEEIILESAHKEDKEKKIFNNAAQAWNHTFLWNGMTTEERREPSADFLKEIEKSFGTVDLFEEEFQKSATELFGSGWLWLVRDADKMLSLSPMKDAGTPLTEGLVPLLACDVWEHAYYLDHQNEREKYVESFKKIINWEFVERNFEKGRPLVSKSMSGNRDQVRPAPL